MTSRPLRTTRSPYRKAVLILLAAVAIVTLLALAERYGALVVQPVRDAWLSIPEPARVAAHAFTTWSLIATLGATATILVLGVVRAARGGHGARVFLLAGGGYAEAMKRRMLRLFQGCVGRTMVVVGGLPDDRLRTDRPRRMMASPTRPHWKWFRIRSGVSELSAAQALHHQAAPIYRPWFSKAISAADRIYFVVTGGGRTGSQIAAHVADLCQRKPTLVTLTGDSPPQLLQAISSPRLYQDPREGKGSSNPTEPGADPGGRRAAWTDGKPQVVTRETPTGLAARSLPIGGASSGPLAGNGRRQPRDRRRGRPDASPTAPPPGVKPPQELDDASSLGLAAYAARPTTIVEIPKLQGKATDETDRIEATIHRVLTACWSSTSARCDDWVALFQTPDLDVPHLFAVAPIELTDVQVAVSSVESEGFLNTTGTRLPPQSMNEHNMYVWALLPPEGEALVDTFSDALRRVYPCNRQTPLYHVCSDMKPGDPPIVVVGFDIPDWTLDRARPRLREQPEYTSALDRHRTSSLEPKVSS